MDHKKLTICLDIGSRHTKMVAGFRTEDSLKIIGSTSMTSRGVRRGAVTDIDAVAEVIEKTARRLENIIGEKIKGVVLSVGGTEIKSQLSKGIVAISRADGEINENDLQRVSESAQNSFLPVNTEIIRAVPMEYKIDDQAGIKNPLGMKGIRLEADILLIEDSVNHLGNLIRATEQAGLRVDDVSVGVLASAEIMLDEEQKEMGSVLIDIGWGTTSLAVFEEGELVAVAVLPIGAGHVTGDVAIGLRIPLTLAEKIKIGYGSVFPKEIGRKEAVDLAKMDENEEGLISRKHIAEIIEARYREIFDLVRKKLAEIGKDGLLPAGAILVGGGSEMLHLDKFAKNILRLPVKVGSYSGITGVVDKVDSLSQATVIGLLASGTKEEKGRFDRERSLSGKGIFGRFKKISWQNDKMKRFGEKVKELAEKFLP